MNPTLLNDWVTSQAFWAFIGFAAFAGLVYYTTEFLKAWHAESAKLDQVLKYGPPEETWCQTHGHNYATDPAGWHCANCGRVVKTPLTCAGIHRWVLRGQSLECSACGQRKTRNVYDNESGVA